MKNHQQIIGDNLNQLRKERRLSLDKVAVMTGVSKSMLSQIEKGSVNPSVSTLWKLANGLKISFTELMTSPEQDLEHIPLSAIESLPADDGRFRNYPIILFDPVRRFETYRIELDPQCRFEAEPHPAGTQEYIYVTGGSLTLVIEGREQTLEKNDTLRFKADVQHTYENRNPELCTLHMILYYPQ